MSNFIILKALMSMNLPSESDSNTFSRCIACNAIPLNRKDKFCRRCGYRFVLACRSCQADIRPYDRFCPTCGTRRLIIFDQIKYYLSTNSPYVVFATAIVLAGAWLALRYSLRHKLK
ncbi:hypothetical protein DICVIV_04283 [Dictyocaulus viviparus]|uniref:DZANK-type domain-containing protein n=1 Tax=Dictyocaulus viviparus TaxID=29172 RepID=A0A0D8Y090_DICVI|nr:hypothetical protein DICVIV_04283 [Dictyocaulus viviparus]